MMDLVVLGVDPGKTTGLALVRWTDTGTAPLSVEQTNWEAAADTCRNLLLTYGDVVPFVVACERYTITMQTLKKTRQLEALYCIGGLITAVRWYGGVACRGLHVQTPGDAKGVVTDALLRKLGWYDMTVGMDHARDALRHATLWLLKERRLDVP